MTTNQTIDGVPLLPCPFCGDTPEITKHHREDIYGLIHRCPVAGAISWGFREDPAAHAERWNRRAVTAAQPNGKPFRWFYAGVAYTHKPHSDAIALYAEQPAPIAVVLPERREPTQDNPYLSDADHEWNAYRDELKRLNPSL